MEWQERFWHWGNIREHSKLMVYINIKREYKDNVNGNLVFLGHMASYHWLTMKFLKEIRDRQTKDMFLHIQVMQAITASRS